MLSGEHHSSSKESIMPTFKAILILVLALPAAALALDAPKEKCSNIQWDPVFLKQYPKAPVACREVTVKDGIKYAKFDGKVAKVDSHAVQVEVSDVMDIPISTVGFQVGVGGKVTMGGKEMPVRDLKVGDELTFWVREGQFGISPTLTEQPLRFIKPDSMPAE